MNELTPEVIAEGRRLLAVWEADPQNLNTGFECWLLDHGGALLDAAEKAKHLEHEWHQQASRINSMVETYHEQKADLARLHAVISKAGMDARGVHWKVSGADVCVRCAESWPCRTARIFEELESAVESRALPEGEA